MDIKNHYLEGNKVTFTKSPNQGDHFQGGYPDTIVLHYTAGANSQSAIDTLCNPIREVSAHLVIARGGVTTQLVAFDTIAWHAGKSSWKGRTLLNRFSIGIEIENAGCLEPTGDVFVSWFGQNYPANEVVRAVHRNQSTPTYWHTYPPVQLQTVERVCSLLINEYKIIDIVGHEEISPDRKQDPGPAFPLDDIRKRLLGERLTPA